MTGRCGFVYFGAVVTSVVDNSVLLYVNYGDRLKALTLNCRGFNNSITRHCVSRALERESLDIVFLQETHLKSLTIHVFSTIRVFLVLDGFHISTMPRGPLSPGMLQFLFQKTYILRSQALGLIPKGGFYLLISRLMTPVIFWHLYMPLTLTNCVFLPRPLLYLMSLKLVRSWCGGELNCIGDLIKDRSQVVASKSKKFHSNSAQHPF